MARVEPAAPEAGRSGPVRGPLQRRRSPRHARDEDGQAPRVPLNVVQVEQARPMVGHGAPHRGERTRVAHRRRSGAPRPHHGADSWQAAHQSRVPSRVAADQVRRRAQASPAASNPPALDQGLERDAGGRAYPVAAHRPGQAPLQAHAVSGQGRRRHLEAESGVGGRQHVRGCPLQGWQPTSDRHHRRLQPPLPRARHANLEFGCDRDTPAALPARVGCARSLALRSRAGLSESVCDAHHLRPQDHT